MRRPLQRSARTCNAALDLALFIRQETRVHRLFVYGSLKREMMHHDELGGALFEGLALVRGHTLVWYEGAYPALTRSSPEDWVEGELYRLSDAQLSQVDAFEQCPELYQRGWVQCEQRQDELMPRDSLLQLSEKQSFGLGSQGCRSALAYLITSERAESYPRLGSRWNGRRS